MNTIRYIRSWEGFKERLGLFEEGYKLLHDPHAVRRSIPNREFFRVLLCTALDERLGALFVLESRIPLGFACVVKDESPLMPGRAELFAIYSNGKCPSTFSELMYEARRWCRRNGVRELVYRMGRTTGAAKRFGRKFFEQVHLEFSTEIL